MSDDPEPIHIDLFTKRSEDSFTKVDAWVNEAGNIVIFMDEQNYAILTPKMAKRLSTRLDEANRQAIAEQLSE